jgi:DNA (cytosine-5)-methyltransferase 1
VAWQAELGNVDADDLHDRISRAIDGYEDWILCGGPPCQAYSIVGRSRKGGIDEDDGRVYLYKEYLKILGRYAPPVFIMENVKGLLSSKIRGSGLFAQILNDLRAPGEAVGLTGPQATYKILSLAREARAFDLNGSPLFEDEDFVIQSERYGIPQMRHRLILMGVREDRYRPGLPTLVAHPEPICVADVLKGLPKLRSGLSKSPDSQDAWKAAIQTFVPSMMLDGLQNGHSTEVGREVSAALERIRSSRADRGDEFVSAHIRIGYRPDWFIDARLSGACNHASRPHMVSDLYRYLFAAAFAKATGRSPELGDFPPALLPAHKNVYEAGKEKYFDDRFRVQLADRPSMTVTCHIAKDGHYYIHFDPSQCRTLTVREAARIQTFPDNYFFCGTRTAQYRQVGNAVPPLLAEQIADVVFRTLRA